MIEASPAAPGSKPWVAAVLSFAVPGLGHAYCGLYARALAIFAGVCGGFLGLAFVVDAVVEVGEGFARIYYVLPVFAAWDAWRCAASAPPIDPPQEQDAGAPTGAAVARRFVAWLQVVPLIVMVMPLLVPGLILGFSFGIAYILQQSTEGSWSAFVKIPAAIAGLGLAAVLAWTLYRSLNATLQVALGQAPADSWQKAVNPWLILLILISAAVIVPMFSNLIRMSKEGATHGNLSSLRSALRIYHDDARDNYPSELSALTKDGKYLHALPQAKPANHHPDSSMIQYLTDAQYAAGELDDSGGWAYVVSGSSAGTVLVNCVHTDIKGRAWSSY